MFPVKVTFVRIVVVPLVTSIAPPARFALFPEKVDKIEVKLPPPLTKIAPPLPLAPFATLLETVTLFVVNDAPPTLIAPPLAEKPFVMVKSFNITVPVVISKILPLAFPSIVVVVAPLPVIVKDLSIIISPVVKTMFVTVGAKVIVAPDAAVAI